MSFKTNNPVVQATADARISAALGSSIQGFSAKLSDVAGLALAANTFIGSDGTNIIIRSASASKTALGLAAVASSAAYSDLTGTPSLASVATSGDYADLTNKPSLFDGTWTSLAGKPSFATVATSGAYADITGTPTLGSASSKDTGTSAGNVPVLDGSGKLDTNVIPALALTSVSVVADITARDALTVQTGDVAVVSAESKSYIYTGSSWQELLSPAGGSGNVASVAGKTGAVTLALSDLTDSTITSPATGQVLRYDGTKFVNAVIGWSDISSKPSFATVATTGDYADLTNKPSLFDGTWTSLSGKPSFATVATSGSYTDLTNTPSFATVATSGSYNDLADKPTIDTSKATVNVHTASGDVTVSSSDFVVIVKKTTGATTTVTLPQGSTVGVGKMITVKDGKGDAAANVITIDGYLAETIDGAATLDINQNYEAVKLIWNGSEWNII